MANKVSTRGDVYSYGILLLEMFTAKSPTDGIFVDGLSLRKFVLMALPEQVMDVIDEQLLLFSSKDEEKTNDSAKATECLTSKTGDSLCMSGAKATECITSVLQLGIICSSEAPGQRPEIGEVVNELHEIRKFFMAN